MTCHISGQFFHQSVFWRCLDYKLTMLTKILLTRRVIWLNLNLIYFKLYTTAYDYVLDKQQSSALLLSMVIVRDQHLINWYTRATPDRRGTSFGSFMIPHLLRAMKGSTLHYTYSKIYQATIVDRFGHWHVFRFQTRAL